MNILVFGYIYEDEFKVSKMDSFRSADKSELYMAWSILCYLKKENKEKQLKLRP